MAIDLRQEQQQRQHTAKPPRPRGTLWMVVAGLVAVVTVGALATVVALQDEPAPAGQISTLSYPEGALTTEREGGVYVVVPALAPAAGITDTSIQVREGGSYVSTDGVTDTSDREGGSYVSTWDAQKLAAYEGRLIAG